MQIIDIYIGKVKKEIYKLSPADDFLNELKSNLIEYSEDNPNCTMDDLIEQFGMPEDIAKEFLDNTVTYTPKIIAKKKKKKENNYSFTLCNIDNCSYILHHTFNANTKYGNRCHYNL